MSAILAETSFIENSRERQDPIHLLKNEAFDRLVSVVDDLPKYKNKFKELIANFTVDDMLYLINTIYRDKEFKKSVYYRVYNEYFDEIEDLIHTMLKKRKI